MPMTPKGKSVLRKMTEHYGKKKAKNVFYAMVNAGKMKGVHKEGMHK